MLLLVPVPALSLPDGVSDNSSLQAGRQAAPILSSSFLPPQSFPSLSTVKCQAYLDGNVDDEVAFGLCPPGPSYTLMCDRVLDGVSAVSVQAPPL